MKITNSPENLAKCLCPSCPSANACMSEKAEALFCARGKATCQFEKKGCICGACPIVKENHLERGYFCDAGAAE